MKVIAVYARIYAGCLAKAFASIGKSPWTLLLPMGLFVAFALLGGLIAAIPFGGILLGLVLDALGSCYLYFLGEVVANSPVSVAEFRKSIGAYFWSIMNLLFVLWIANFALGYVLKVNPKGPVIYLLLELVALVLLNAVPEVLYQKGTYGGIDTIRTAVHFIQEHWLEWFVPNVLIGVAVWAFWTRVMPLLGFMGVIATAVGSGALFHVVMVFRGHLFQELDGSSHRQRMFRYRSGT